MIMPVILLLYKKAPLPISSIVYPPNFKGIVGLEDFPVYPVITPAPSYTVYSQSPLVYANELTPVSGRADRSIMIARTIDICFFIF